MGDVKDLLKVYESRLSNRVRILADPLQAAFGITEFIYNYTANDGEFFAISNQPAPSEMFYSHRLYKASSLMKHPDNFEDGIIMPMTHSEPKYWDKIEAAYGYSDRNFLAIFKKERGCVHQFLFNADKSINLLPIYATSLKALERFCDYFLENWKAYRSETDPYRINIAELIGADFRRLNFPANKSKSVQQKLTFLKKIGVLDPDFQLPQGFSQQEKACLKQIYRGKTLKETALELDLSIRTVESYFENIKDKTGCFTKSEVMQLLYSLDMLDLF